MRILKILGILFLLYISCSGQQLVDGVAAVVGNEIVLKSEVDQYLQSYVIQNNINVRNNPEMLKKLQIQILDKLVEQKILLTKADEDTILADERDVEQRVNEHIRYLIQQVGSEQKLEEAFQNPIKKIRRDLKKETAERLKVEILRRKKFQAVKITRREVENFFTSFQDSIPDINETVEISHILRQIKPGEASVTEAMAKIGALKEQLDQGVDFAKLAEAFSEDVATAKRGGDLGFTQRGDFVQEFEEAAFALNPGEVSDIVRSQFGFHIIKLIERRGEKIRSSHILIRLQPTEEDEKRIASKLTEIKEEIVQGASFDSLALEYSEDENVANDKGNLGVWEVEKLAIQAFKSIVKKLQPGDISEPFKTEYGYHIVKLHNRQDQRKLTLENDWEQVQQIALNYKIDIEYKNWIAGIRSDIPIQYKIAFE